MSATDASQPDPIPGGSLSSAPGGLLDQLNVAAVVLDANGRVALWSPQAESLFGYTAEEALGRFAGRLLVHEEHLDMVIGLFAQVMENAGSWAGVFPVRHKDGSTRLVEFRNMRLQDDRRAFFALGLAIDQETLRAVERDVALSSRLISQAPIGLAVLDTELRYVTVNPALAHINGLPAADHLGRYVREALPFLDADAIEASMRQVLATGVPLIDQHAVGRTPAHAGDEQAWSVSYFRLESPSGQVIGLATSVVDVTDRHRAATEAARARRRLAVIADASVLIGTTLDLDRTAQELADVVVPDLADLAAVDVLDSVLMGYRGAAAPMRGPTVFRALALAAAFETEAIGAADRTGELAKYDTDRLVTQCVTRAEPVLIPHVESAHLPQIARSPEAAVVLARAGLHSYLAVPLIARGEVLGALDLKRFRNPLPFDDDDVVLAGELAARAAVCIDNARWFQRERNTALTLQRNLLPQRPPVRAGLEIAYRYEPAQAAGEVGGDWFDVIPLSGDKTALVVGDVMGSGVDAAATMGRLSAAVRALAGLDLEPDQVLRHIDRSTFGLEQSIATCVYAVHDPHQGQCRISLAGHLPPARVRPGRPPELLDLPTGTPLGVGDVPFTTTTFRLRPGDELVLYTDGLVENREEDIDTRLALFLSLLDAPGRPLEETCDGLLQALRHPDDHDDVALLIARVLPFTPGS